MPKPFTHIFNELRYGAAATDANDALIKAVAAVKATGRAATVTVKLVLRPPRKGGMHYIAIDDEVSVKLPAPERPDSVFFPTADNGLSKHDPQQRQLALGAVDSETGEIIGEEQGSAA